MCMKYIDLLVENNVQPILVSMEWSWRPRQMWNPFEEGEDNINLAEVF